MPDQNVNQEPITLEELLYAKSLPVLSKMLAPALVGEETPAANYRVIEVKLVNRQTVVVIEQTKDPKVDIGSATSDQIVVREIPYHRYHIGEVLRHKLGKLGTFGVATVPKTKAELNTWLAGRLVLDDDVHVHEVNGIVTVQPTALDDLKWYGVAQLVFEVTGVEPEPELTAVTLTFNGSPVVAEANHNIEDGNGLIEFGFTPTPSDYTPTNVTWSLTGSAKAEVEDGIVTVTGLTAEDPNPTPVTLTVNVDGVTKSTTLNLIYVDNEA